MIKILFYITLIAFCLGQLARIQLPNAIAVTILDLSVFFLVLAWVVIKLINRERLKGDLLRPLILFISICLLSLVINSFYLKSHELVVAFSYLVRWILYAGIYFIIKEQNKVSKKQIHKFLIGVIIIHLFIGFSQYFFFSNLKPLFYLGWDDHLYRMFGSVLDPNFQGIIYVLFFCFLLSVTLSREKIVKDYPGAGLAFLSVVTLIAVVLTYSRNALIMLFVSLTIILIYKGNRKIIASLFFATLIFVVFFSNVTIENLNPFRTASTSARLATMRDSLVIIEKHPIFGVGFNAYRYAQYRYNLRNPSPMIVSHADSGTDNSYLFILATTGVVGLFTYMYLLWSVIKIGKKSSSIMRVVLLSSIGGILLSALFINSLFYTFIMFWLWIQVGLTESS